MILVTLLISSFKKLQLRQKINQICQITTLQATTQYHVPVLLDECCNYLNVREGGIYVDCTLGGGGHTKAILELGGRVVGIDQDTDAIKHTSTLLTQYIESKKLEIVQSNFRLINDVVRSSSTWSSEVGNVDTNFLGVDGILMDLGVSSHQIDINGRGFSFGKDGPLDMRMNQGENIMTL